MRALRLSLLGIWGISLIVFVLQNRIPEVTLTLAGSVGPTLPLSLALLSAYIVGGVIAVLLLGCWWLHDYWQQRQTSRLLIRLSDRIALIESQNRRPALTGSYRPTVGDPLEPSEVVEGDPTRWSTEKWDS